MSRWRVLAISPGAQCTGLASWEADVDTIALRAFELVGHRNDASLDARLARLRAALLRVLARERPALVVVEEPPEGHRVPPLRAALETVHATVASAGLPVLQRALADARRVACGSLRPISMRTAALAIAVLAPRVARYVPPPPVPKPKERVRTAAERHWARAWTAAVLGLAAVEERDPTIQPTRQAPNHS